MTWEAIRLQSWYATAQGAAAARVVGEALEPWLSARKVEATLGLGFTQPYLGRLGHFSKRLLGCAPAEMGVAPWPPAGANRIALIHPNALPFPDESFDRVAVTHLLEGTESPRSALREIWRVLQPGGRLILMVSNRGGYWARRDASPLGWGRPFSPNQVKEQLLQTLFIPKQYKFALFFPPVFGDRFLGAANAWEKAGQRWFAPLGGVVLCEAEKVVYAGTPLTVETQTKRRLAPLAGPAGQGRARASNREANDE